MVVLDAGPIIHFARVGKLQLLQQLFEEVEIPRSVYQETVVEAKEARKRGVAAIEATVQDGWLRVVKLTRADQKFIDRIANAEVIYLAKKSAATLVTSDKIVIAAARALEVPTAWTTTVVLMAVKQGVLDKLGAKRLLRELVRMGLRLKAEVYEALVQAIEAMH